MPRYTTLCVAIAAAVAVVFAGSPLPRITPDSATYLTGAERIADGEGFEDCKGSVTLFAPGYSAAMAPLVVLGLDAPDAARVVNGLATLGLVVGAWFLALAAGLSQRLSAGVAVAVAISYATLRNGALAWSEPLFCALLAWALVLAANRGRCLEARVSTLAAVLVALTWALLLTRHSGVFVLPAVLLAAWLGSSRLRFRIARVSALGILLVSLPAVWWARNVRIDGEPFGRRSESRYSVLEVLEQLPRGLSSLALPNATPFALRLAVFVPLAAAAVLAWRARASRSVVSVLTLAVVVYAVAVAVAATRTVVDPLDTRLLSPILAPFAVLVAVGIARRRTRLERALAGWALAVVVVTAALAPGVAWQSHEAERDLAAVDVDVSCAEWPARYRAYGEREITGSAAAPEATSRSARSQSSSSSTFRLS